MSMKEKCLFFCIFILALLGCDQQPKYFSKKEVAEKTDFKIFLESFDSLYKELNIDSIKFSEFLRKCDTTITWIDAHTNCVCCDKKFVTEYRKSEREREKSKKNRRSAIKRRS